MITGQGSVLALISAARDMDWAAEAPCGTTDPEIFWPGTGDSAKPARAICAGCPARTECLEWALEHDEPGIWGGTSEPERAAIRRNRKQAAA